MDKDKFSTVNTIYIEGEIEDIWWYFSTLEGWNSFLTDVATHSENKPVIELGDELDFIIGELSNKTICIVRRELDEIVFWDRYTGLLPDGTTKIYELHTAFSLTQVNDRLVKIIVTVDGYDSSEIMQWIRECGEMGWRQTLFNLKCIIELGLDLRNDIFNYPRIGVINYTATKEQLEKSCSKFNGNYLLKVYPNSPADEAGLLKGDIVTHINDEPVETYYTFVKTLSSYFNQSNNVTLTFVRSGQVINTEIQLTYDDQFTGMINPKETPLELVEKIRIEKSQIKK
ncbi:PDZ domain-containing protein [Oceanobacillus profundus]|uniref:PDZ domain-containing protein n=1 Tax=Oceanobacillus TaxID=182709 RepID=UPI000BA6820B|nr:PDZ domain-containing protein [Oceanobacillus profundus]MCM3399727.1 PDZ domain-containing protein [Oceanobacillus profundus]PAE28234.1 hypothetical protein CHI07_15745 [Paenibacillus sp. 7884-2]